MREHFEGGRSLEVAVAVEQPLGDDPGPGRHAQTVERAGVVDLAGRAVAGDDAGDVRAVAVLVGGIDEVPVEEERGHTARQVRMHVVGPAGVQAAIRHGDAYSGAVEAQQLGACPGRSAIAADNFGGDLVKQLYVRSRFDPEDGRRVRECLEGLAGDHAAKDDAEPVPGLLMNGLKSAPDPGDLIRPGAWGKQNGHGLRRGLRTGLSCAKAALQFVLGFVFAHPADKRQGAKLRQAHAIQTGDERIIGHVLEQLDALVGQRGAPGRLKVVAKLDQIEAGGGLRTRGRSGGGVGLIGSARVYDPVVQSDETRFALRGPSREDCHGRQHPSPAPCSAELHSNILAADLPPDKLRL